VDYGKHVKSIECFGCRRNSIERDATDHLIVCCNAVSILTNAYFLTTKLKLQAYIAYIIDRFTCLL